MHVRKWGALEVSGLGSYSCYKARGIGESGI